MALLHQATLTPSKLDVLSAWVPAQPWLGEVDASTLQALGAYRFDDPAGEVGIETHVLQAASGQILHVPVTYRDEPLDGAQAIHTECRHCRWQRQAPQGFTGEGRMRLLADGNPCFLGIDRSIWPQTMRRCLDGGPRTGKAQPQLAIVPE